VRAPPQLRRPAAPEPDARLRDNFAWRYYYSGEFGFSRQAVQHLRHHRIEWAVHLLRAAGPLSSHSLLVDVGCGPGESTVVVNRELGPFDRVVGLDVSPLLGPLCVAMAHANGAPARYLRGTCLALPVRDGSAALVVSFEMVEHVPAWIEFLREARRALEPGGLILVSTPHARGFHALLKGPYRWVRGFERLSRAHRKDGEFYERFIPGRELVTGFASAGLRVLDVVRGCHTLTVTPIGLFAMNAAVERALEGADILSAAAVTVFVVAQKPA